MTAISPTAFGDDPADADGDAETNQLNQDTFLKLLVAQMKYQNPLAPTDSTAVPHPDRAVHDGEHAAADREGPAGDPAHQPAARGERHGRARRHLLDRRHRADDRDRHDARSRSAATWPQDAPVGAHVTVNTAVFNNVGSEDPARSSSSRAPPTAGRCRRRATAQQIGPPSNDHVRRDAANARAPTSRSPRPTSTASPARAAPGRATGITIEMGSADRSRTGSRWARAPRSVAVLEQNGGDGQSLTGVVTGIRITADGPLLQVDGRDVPLASVMEVQAPAF